MAAYRYGARAATTALIFAVVIAAGPAGRVSANPSFSDDFTADIISRDLGANWTTSGLGSIWTDGVRIDGQILNFGLGGRGLTGEADLFYDYSGHRAKYQLPDRDIFIFYDDRRSYEVSITNDPVTHERLSGFCRSHALSGEMPQFFAWLVDAIKISTSCFQFMNSGAKGVQYNLDLDNGEVLQFCGSTDEKTPYWVGWSLDDKFAWIEFKTYNGGEPNASNFELPDSCRE